MKSIPISVVGAGNRPLGETSEYLPMPHDMAVFRTPVVRGGACAATVEVRDAIAGLLDAMRDHEFGGFDAPELDLATLSPDGREALNRALGRGEVSIVIRGSRPWRIEETIFPGIWHVLGLREDGGVAEDRLEVAPVPAVLRSAMFEGATHRVLPVPAAADGLMNAPALVAELVSRSAKWRPGKPTHVINLTLRPVTHHDIDYLVQALGSGPATVLSRGFGNCRISSTLLPNTWWVQYFDGMDQLVLNTLEVIDVPEAALAVREDFENSTERLAEWLDLLPAD